MPASVMNAEGASPGIVNGGEAKPTQSRNEAPLAAAVALAEDNNSATGFKAPPPEKVSVPTLGGTAANWSGSKPAPATLRTSSTGNSSNAPPIQTSSSKPGEMTDAGAKQNERKGVETRSTTAASVKTATEKANHEISWRILPSSAGSSTTQMRSTTASRATTGSFRQGDGTEIAGPQSPVAFHAAKVVQRMGGEELKLVVNSETTGQVQLSTSLRQNEVQLTVSTERPEIAAAMRKELPSLDAHLLDHTLRLGEVHIVAEQGGLSSGLGMAGQQQHAPRQWNRPAPIPQRAAASAATEESVGYPTNVDGRISVLA